ncbi:hypothetical protein ACF0H5_014075 [Mactra antiquata]
MDVRIERTILIKRKTNCSIQQTTPRNKLMNCMCCIKLWKQCEPTCSDDQKKTITKVRFREPNKVEPVKERHPSWTSYHSWSSQELDVALDDFIHQTLTRVTKSILPGNTG